MLDNIKFWISRDIADFLVLFLSLIGALIILVIPGLSRIIAEKIKRFFKNDKESEQKKKGR